MTELERFEEKRVSSTDIFDGFILHLKKDTVTLPDGKEAFREYIRHVGAVCVVPLTDEGEVVCVKQYRYPLGEVTLEIPAGKLNSKDEDRDEAILRELREETGAVCSSLTYMGKFVPSPAILDECIHMYLAEGLEFGETDPDEDEFLDIVKIPIDQLARDIVDGKIIDGKTQAAIMRVVYMLSQRK